MTRVYKVKTVPMEVYGYFKKRFPMSDGYSYKFYWYKGIEGKTYGCEVYKNGEYWHNASQATCGKFAQMTTAL